MRHLGVELLLRHHLLVGQLARALHLLLRLRELGAGEREPGLRVLQRELIGLGIDAEHRRAFAHGVADVDQNADQAAAHLRAELGRARRQHRARRGHRGLEQAAAHGGGLDRFGGGGRRTRCTATSGAVDEGAAAASSPAPPHAPLSTASGEQGNDRCASSSVERGHRRIPPWSTLTLVSIRSGLVTLIGSGSNSRSRKAMCSKRMTSAELLRVEVGAQLAARDPALDQRHQALAPVFLRAPAQRTQMRSERDRGFPIHQVAQQRMVARVLDRGAVHRRQRGGDACRRPGARPRPR